VDLPAGPLVAEYPPSGRAWPVAGGQNILSAGKTMGATAQWCGGWSSCTVPGYLHNVGNFWSAVYPRELHVQPSSSPKHGFVVLDVDYRASAGYGRDWRTAILPLEWAGRDLAGFRSMASKYLTATYGIPGSRVGRGYGGELRRIHHADGACSRRRIIRGPAGCTPLGDGLGALQTKGLTTSEHSEQNRRMTHARVSPRSSPES